MGAPSMSPRRSGLMAMRDPDGSLNDGGKGRLTPSVLPNMARCGTPAHQCRQCIRGDRSAEEIALGLVATQQVQQTLLLLGLYALRHDFELE